MRAYVVLNTVDPIVVQCAHACGCAQGQWPCARSISIGAHTVAEDHGRHCRGPARRLYDPSCQNNVVFGREGNGLVGDTILGRRNMERIARRMGVGVDQDKGKGDDQDDDGDKDVHGGLHRIRGQKEKHGDARRQNKPNRYAISFQDLTC